MAAPHLTLKFGDQTFQIRPLTVDQVEALENTVNDPEIAKSPTGLGKAILGVALARDHGATSVGEIESTLPELATAMADILKYAGFIEGPAPGEPPAAAETASRGRKSARA